MNRVWALIPARGGSKRLPRKNIMPMGGSSLVARTVKTAVASGCFARVVVSTDDAEIAEDARSAGAEVPFIRPACLADDSASSLDVLLHAVEYLLPAEGRGSEIAAVCLLQPTSPFLSAVVIREAVQKFFDNGFNSLSTMREVADLPEWMFRVDQASGRATPEHPAGIIMPRSAVSKRFIENGALYLTKIAYLLEQRSMYDFSCHGCLQMSAAESVDIDTSADWQYAEFLLAGKPHKAG